MRILCFLALVVLVGCATSTAQPLPCPNSPSEYIIKCDVWFGMDSCYSKAGEMCPSGFKVTNGNFSYDRGEIQILCPKW